MEAGMMKWMFSALVAAGLVLGAPAAAGAASLVARVDVSTGAKRLCDAARKLEADADAPHVALP
jgi:isopentenyl diphosphate isomerase/L-lactate dehydrogenase-like FMN-dependent dehydrogenase